MKGFYLFGILVRPHISAPLNVRGVELKMLCCDTVCVMWY